MEGSELLHLLSHCTGTTQYFRHWTRALVYTDGVKLLAEHGGAYWLIDLVASHQPNVRRVLKKRIQEAGHPDNVDNRQVWELEVDGGQAVATCRIQSDPASAEPIVQQEIPLTDFPIQGKTRLYLYDDVLLLPSES